MSLDEIFADVKKEGSDPFAQFDKETETPTESQPVKEQDKEEPNQGDAPKEEAIDIPKDNTEDDNTPFHIRWQKREEKLKADFDQKFEEYKRDLEKTVEEKTAPKDITIPEWFTELYGDNQVAWEKYEAREKSREEEIEKRVFEKYESKQKEQKEEVNKWEKWVDDQVTVLQSEGKKFDRNELIKTVLDFRPTDEQNNFDFRKGYEIMEALKAKSDPVNKEASIARKQIADTTTKNKGNEKPIRDYQTPADLRNKSWNQIN